jgi:hypothetical protein
MRIALSTSRSLLSYSSIARHHRVVVVSAAAAAPPAAASMENQGGSGRGGRGTSSRRGGGGAGGRGNNRGPTASPGHLGGGRTQPYPAGGGSSRGPPPSQQQQQQRDFSSAQQQPQHHAPPNPHPREPHAPSKGHGAKQQQYAPQHAAPQQQQQVVNSAMASALSGVTFASMGLHPSTLSGLHVSAVTTWRRAGRDQSVHMCCWRRDHEQLLWLPPAPAPHPIIAPWSRAGRRLCVPPFACRMCLATRRRSWCRHRRARQRSRWVREMS